MKKILVLLPLVAVFGLCDEPLKAKCVRDNSNDTVTCTDKIHGKLMWQDGSDIAKENWEDAKQYCKDLNYAGYSDWRLPTRTELLTIVDYARYNRAINRAFKNIIINNECWSSTFFAKGSTYAWYVDFYNGLSTGCVKSFELCVRCVR